MRERDGVGVIDLSGDIDAAAEERSTRPTTRRRAAGADRSSSTSARRLHQLHRDRPDRRAAGAGARDGIEVTAFGLSDHYREIFEITRLADFMTIADDETRRERREEEADA